MILRIFPNLLVAPFKDGTDFPFDICVLTKKLRNKFLASGNLLFVWSFSQKAPWKLRFADQILKNDKKEPTSAPKSNPACISSDSTIKLKLVFRQARIKNQEKHRQSVPCEWDNSLPDPWSTGTTGVGSFGIGISFTGCSTGATGRSYRIFFHWTVRHYENILGGISVGASSDSVSSGSSAASELPAAAPDRWGISL